MGEIVAHWSVSVLLSKRKIIVTSDQKTKTPKSVDIYTQYQQYDKFKTISILNYC